MQLRSSLETSSREIGGASEEYSDFVLERLQLVIRSLTNIGYIFESHPNVQFSDDELVVLRKYSAIIIHNDN